MKSEIINQREIKKSIEIERKKKDFREYIARDESIEELFKLLYIEKITTKEELKNRLKINNIKFDMVYNILIEDTYIEEIEYKKEIKNDKRTFIKAGILFDYLICNGAINDDLINKATKKDRKGRLIDGIGLGIADHTTIEHFADIKYLIKICERENIFNLQNFEDTKVKLNKDDIADFRYSNSKRVEADLILKYNKQWYLCEVERGTTSNADTKKKMNKLQQAVYSAKEEKSKKGFSNVVIVAVPNSKSLEKVKKKIKEWEEDYDWRYGRKETNKKRNLIVLYINLSSIARTKGKNLESRIKKAKQKAVKGIV